MSGRMCSIGISQEGERVLIEIRVDQRSVFGVFTHHNTPVALVAVALLFFFCLILPLILAWLANREFRGLFIVQDENKICICNLG